jgi:hypothetical protein
MPRLKIYQPVQTPNGRGLVQGRLVENGNMIRILVSHRPDAVPPEILNFGNYPYMGGPFVLVHYDPDEVEPV